MPTLMMFYEGDDVKVKEDKIQTLLFSHPDYLVDEIKRPSAFFKRVSGRVVECDWDKKRKAWTHFVSFVDRKSKQEIILWFLESELELV